MGNGQITQASSYVTIKLGDAIPDNIRKKLFLGSLPDGIQLLSNEKCFLFYEPAGRWITMSYFPFVISTTNSDSPIDEFYIITTNNFIVNKIYKRSKKSFWCIQ